MKPVPQRISVFISLTLYLAASMISSTSASADETSDLQVGDTLPSFSANDDEGGLWSSGDRIGGGKYLVVYFYPAAMTGGCTKQACAYRDHSSTLAELGIEVVGVSGDSVINLRYFRDAHGLNFTLLSDADGSIADKLGVPARGGESSITREVDGRNVVLSRSFTSSRWTFIFAPDGKLIYKDTEVAAAEDSKKVIDFLRQHGGE